MKKVVFSSGMETIHLADTAMTYENQGNDVVFIMCDGCLGMCTMNIGRSKVKCKLCSLNTSSLTKKFSRNIKVKYLSEYDSKIDKTELEKLDFKYSSIEDIKKIKFHGVNVGYAAVSTYVYRTRNLDPLVDRLFIEFMNSLLRTTCYLTLLFEKIIEIEQPAEVTCFNGRFCDNRPLLDLCFNNGIHTHACDGICVTKKKVLKNVFYDCLPQSLENAVNLLNGCWNNPLVPLYEKEQIGRWFFESKINQRFSADTNYVKNQSLGSIPDNWNDNIKNYVIFNSSEDEFRSIDEDWDNAKIFPDQINGIRFICSTLQTERPEARIYLRIHPNLKNIRYKYHTSLLTLSSEFPNLTVIPGDSKISSYSLMHKAYRVIVFGSTMGIESAYAKKIVINLHGSLYDSLNICYKPRSIDEFRSMLLNDSLPALDNYNCLKFGYSVLNTDVPNYIYLNNDRKSRKEKILDAYLNYNLVELFKSVIYRFRIKFMNDELPVPVKEV